MQRLISWDQLEVHVDGPGINGQAAPFRVAPIEKLELQFSNGLLHIAGTIKKLISVPFTVDVREIKASGQTVRVLVASATVFGALHVPQFLFSLVKSQLPADLISYEEPATFVVSLKRFLPPFLDADIQKILIIDGGLAVTLGRGGADLPQSSSEAAHG